MSDEPGLDDGGEDTNVLPTKILPARVLQYRIDDVYENLDKARLDSMLHMESYHQGYLDALVWVKRKQREWAKDKRKKRREHGA